MTLAEFKEKVQKEDPAIMANLMRISAQVKGTRAYFKRESQKLGRHVCVCVFWDKDYVSIILSAGAYELAMRIASQNQETFNTFLTFSLADLHADDLHRHMPNSEEYLGKIVVSSWADVPVGANEEDYITKRDDYQKRMTAVKENGQLVHELACQRIKIFVEEVLKKEYAVSEYIIRSEFQHRGTIHFHLLARIPGLLMDQSVTASTPYTFDYWPKEVLNNPEKWAERRVYDANCLVEMTEEERKNALDTNRKLGVDVEAGDSDELIERVLASRTALKEFTVQQVGTMAVHADSNWANWKPPYGPASAPPENNCLRLPFKEVKDVTQDYIDLMNRVMTHKCTSSCLRQSKHNTGQFICRFGFPKELAGYRQMKPDNMTLEQFEEELKQPNQFARYLARDVESAAEGAEIDPFETAAIVLLRNHPMLVEHIPEMLSLWRANIDGKVVVNNYQLRKYIMKYIMKPEPTSENFETLVKKISETAAEDVPLRKVVQRILLTNNKGHDVGIAEVFLNASQMNYVTYPRSFCQIKLTSTVAVNVEGGPDDPAIKENNGVAERYWRRETDPKYKQVVEEFENGTRPLEKDPKLVSLYEFAMKFETSWRYRGEIQVPIWSPLLERIPNRDDPKWWPMWCRNTLLLHKPGAKPDDYPMENNDESDEAIKNNPFCANIDDFVRNDPSCPVAIRVDYINKMDLNEEEQTILTTRVREMEELCPPEDIPHMEPLQDEWMAQLGPAGANIPTNRITEADTDMTTVNAEDLVEHNLSHDHDHDWSVDAQELNLTTERDFTSLQGWLNRTRTAVEGNSEVATEHTYRPEALNTNQKKVFDVCVEVLKQSTTYRRLRNTEEEVTDAGEGKLILVNGAAGTGKSFLINTLLEASNELVGRSNRLIRIACPTGTAAANFTGGKTLHSLLSIYPKKNKKNNDETELEPLGAGPLLRLQTEFQDTEILVIGNICNICNWLKHLIR